jgi:hypothetical protein
MGGSAERTHEPWELQPDEYQQDLNPDGGAGLNVDLRGPHPEKSPNLRTAYDLKEVHRRMQGFTDDELKAIPVMPQGSRLEQGATYIDLSSDHPQEFTAMGGMRAEGNNCYVPKTEVDYVLWNRLIGVDNPERLNQADD